MLLKLQSRQCLKKNILFNKLHKLPFYLELVFLVVQNDYRDLLKRVLRVVVWWFRTSALILLKNTALKPPSYWSQWWTAHRSPHTQIYSLKTGYRLRSECRNLTSSDSSHMKKVTEMILRIPSEHEKYESTSKDDVLVLVRFILGQRKYKSIGADHRTYKKISLNSPPHGQLPSRYIIKNRCDIGYILIYRD